MRKYKSLIGLLSLVLFLIGAYFTYTMWDRYKKNNIKKEGYLYIPKGASLNQVIDSLSPFLLDKKSFEAVAVQKKLAEKIKTGRYKIEKGTGNNFLVNMIKAGNQTEDTFRIGDFDTVYQMIGRVTRKTQKDSLAFVTSFDSIAKSKGLSSAEDLKSYFFSDTYQFYWTVEPKDFFIKFEKEYQQFWSPERIAQVKKLGLTRNQVYALASIVFKESGGKTTEQKTIAGLYLNRYKKGMKLQSDPTVIYAITKEENFQKEIKRVLYKHLAVASPYNTYAMKGIPPGPICVVDKTSVDAVLQAEKHPYLFMCADPKKLGYHKFTASDKEHAQNAKAYQDWLNAQKIK